METKRDKQEQERVLMPGTRIQNSGRLAPYACTPEASSRLHLEEADPFRNAFERDCDRIVHSSAFRRLMRKTQVFVNIEGDLFRTRLTHTIEVSRVARTIASNLSINADLAESAALAHDLGHTPFGHAGEEELEKLMRPYGGFEHNAQAIRIVTFLERHYPKFDGLNLTFETLEAIAKHNGPIRGNVPYALEAYNRQHDLRLDTWPNLEAQVASIADDIAYNCHDLHDGMRAKLFGVDEIEQLSLIGPEFRRIRSRHAKADESRCLYQALSGSFSALVTDVLRTTRNILFDAKPECPDDVRLMGAATAKFSPSMEEKVQDINKFLSKYMYRNDEMEGERDRGRRIIRNLFEIFLDDSSLLPPEWGTDFIRTNGDGAKARLVADYIAGMTDRFAIQTHSDLVDSKF